MLSMQALLARTFNKYLKLLRTLSTFLTDYKETPRSKLIKKYIPPLQPCVEDRDLESRRSSMNSQYVLENNLSAKVKFEHSQR